jgi:hypothetical protein
MVMPHRCWISVLAALLVALLVGGVGASGEAGAGSASRSTTRTVTIPAAAFTPITGDADYSKLEADLHLDSGTGTFETPVYFEAPVVQIRKVVFYVVDAGAGGVAAGVYRVQLAENLTIHLGESYSIGSGSWEAQTVTVSDLTERRVSGAYGVVLNVYLPGTGAQGYKLLGAKVTYSY